MTWQGNDLTKHKAIYSPATGWITRTIKQVCPYRCKSVSRHWSFNLLLANVAAKKGSTYLNFLSSCKPISRPFFCLALALHPSSFFSRFFWLYLSVLYWLWPDVQGGQGRSTWAGIIWNWWWKFRSYSHPWLEASSFHLSRSISTTSFSLLTLSPLPVLPPYSSCVPPPPPQPSSSSSNHTWLPHYRFRGSKDSKAINSSEWISSGGNLFYKRGRHGEKDRGLVVVWQAYKCRYELGKREEKVKDISSGEGAPESVKGGSDSDDKTS